MKLKKRKLPNTQEIPAPNAAEKAGKNPASAETDFQPPPPAQTILQAYPVQPEPPPPGYPILCKSFF